jgi:hypothetical protein
VVGEVMRQRIPAAEIFTDNPSAREAAFAAYRAYPTAAFKVPVFVGIGLKDEMTSPTAAFAMARKACALGSNVTVHFYPGLNHSGTVVPSQADSGPFVDALFAGRPPAGTCAAMRYPAEGG